ncbi:Rei1p [Sugiyamaella lignohabitans]|uniref:Rei1p n=1 Tax=Sugiyamaella lignohabitans TaxID=796027 RepID=A0A167FUH2_9ASCO|nr:Rei1p [Sugiyamaella lignohabitans]ANB15718.1 Rei1p [Sugiyamaella lignohabitans]
MNEIVVTEPNRGGEGAPLFTCNTCGLTFPTADLQRIHMKTDWHRYNLKRRVASLPPISSEMFAEKMINQQHIQKLAEERTGRGSSSRSSGQRQVTKKDKKREERLLRKATSNNRAASSTYSKTGGSTAAKGPATGEEISRPSSPEGSVASGISSTFSLGDPVGSHYAPSVTDEDSDLYNDDSEEDTHYTKAENVVPVPETREVSDDEDLDEDARIEKELARYKAKALHIPPNVCLVDGKELQTVEENVAYMTKKYGLYVPEQEYLVDLEGLITYLGEKVGLGNMCLACSFQGRNVESVRAHMIAKSHVRIPYETTQEKLEVSEFYDFSSSYTRKSKAPANDEVEYDGNEDEDDWEEVDEDDDDDFGDDDEVPEDEIVDDSGFELALAPGLRAGHRSLQRYYKQSLRSNEITREGQGTVMAVDVRSAGLITARDPVEEKQQKLIWKNTRKQQNINYRRDKFINQQKHYRDELLQ